jgi:glyoxylase-like metal-dependent hydrolase (beta-lactamase superfamily II)
VYIGHAVKQVQETFAGVYGIPSAELEGSFDGYLHENETFRLGNLEVTVMALPGHTPDSMGILVGDSLFAGDSIFL